MRFSFARTLILNLLLLVLSAAAVQAKDNGRVAGNVKTITGNPLRDAIVAVFQDLQQKDSISIARTDNRGFFKLPNLSPGTYYLHVSHAGYQAVTTANIIVGPGKTTSLDLILYEFINHISRNDDPRNWDPETVMRSSSDRRLIFRQMPGDDSSCGEGKAPEFYRSGTMNVASGTTLGSDSFVMLPQTTQSGVTSNFAITEPVSQHSRMILSGQLDFGGGSFWRVRNTYNYRPDSQRDYRVSVGYGRMSTSYLGSSSFSPQLFARDPGTQESTVQTVAFGLEGNSKFFDLLTVKYGFDYSRLYHGSAKSLFYPSLQILITPFKGWNFKTSFTSRRLSDTNSVVLPDGELLNLSEPTLITMVGNQVSMSQVRHSEISAQKALGSDTAVEVAIYQDNMQGPGLPLLITTITPLERKSSLVELNEDHSNQRGLRITMNRRLLDALSGSVAYVYGTAANVSNISEPMSSGHLAGSLPGYLQQRYYHSLTGQIDAILPVTKTTLLATVRWYPGNPLTPIDWFSDRMDIGTKSVNFEIRQSIPLPEFMGLVGRWEALVDLRNLFDQGRESMATTDGELVLSRNPRSLRFGLNLNFR